MHILLDIGVPRGIAAALVDHVVEEARVRGWNTLKNGELLEAAEQAGFDLFITTDKNLRYQQNLTARKIAIVILGSGRWTTIKLHLTAIADAANSAVPHTFIEVKISER